MLFTIVSCSNGDTRLVGGQSEMEGRVEVCVNNRWGTVCDKQWSSAHSKVICRYLGFNDNEGNEYKCWEKMYAR